MAFINTLYNLWPDGDKRIPGLRDSMARTAPARMRVPGAQELRGLSV